MGKSCGQLEFFSFGGKCIFGTAYSVQSHFDKLFLLQHRKVLEVENDPKQPCFQILNTHFMFYKQRNKQRFFNRLNFW